jgi:hypothetical protein
VTLNPTSQPKFQDFFTHSFTQPLLRAPVSAFSPCEHPSVGNYHLGRVKLPQQACGLLLPSDLSVWTIQNARNYLGQSRCLGGYSSPGVYFGA